MADPATDLKAPNSPFSTAQAKGKADDDGQRPSTSINDKDVKHADQATEAMNAFTDPSTNSCKRLMPGRSIPGTLIWIYLENIAGPRRRWRRQVRRGLLP